MSPACGFRAELGKAHADTAVLLRARVAGGGGREGARTSGMTREALSTEAAALADRLVVVLSPL